ncbi:MAG: hypothetical protein LBV30_07930 [Propionibacteriaceae bacterium]|jgi:hypothetical protein|nr:hypothetical protein [Propionibacteriaceae bacterium]
MTIDQLAAWAADMSAKGFGACQAIHYTLSEDCNWEVINSQQVSCAIDDAELNELLEGVIA